MNPLKIVLLTPGTGSYHCGVCMRDNALAKELVRQGHDAIMLPMYLPLTLDEESAAPDGQIFFGGVSTYLREKVPWLRSMPGWLDRLLSSRRLLKLLAGHAAKTGGPEVAGMTVSMLRGEEGNQASEIERLVDWMETGFDGKKPDSVWLSTALQAGLARRIKARLKVPVIGFLQGEDTFLDGLGDRSQEVWTLLAERMRDADAWVAPSDYFARLMMTRLGWSEVEGKRLIPRIPNGLSLAGYPETPAVERLGTEPRQTPTIGYLARMIPGKGLGLLVEAFIILKQRNRVEGLRLRCAGSMTNHDQVYVKRLQGRLAEAGFAGDVDWLPNVDRAEKISFLSGLDVFSVPATYSEAFGQYVIEALAAGVPVVLPKASAFPEIIEQTQGGALFDFGSSEKESAERLAEAIEGLLLDRQRLRQLGAHGHRAIREGFSIGHLAERLVGLTREKIDALTPAG